MFIHTHTQTTCREKLWLAAVLNMAVITLIATVLIVASFDVNSVALKLIQLPVERMVVTKQSMEALLRVFAAVTKDDTNLDQSMDAITSACCEVCVYVCVCVCVCVTEWWEGGRKR